MRYGTVPIAHATGGLMDTIENFNPFSKGGYDGGSGPARVWQELWPTVLPLDAQSTATCVFVSMALGSSIGLHSQMQSCTV